MAMFDPETAALAVERHASISLTLDYVVAALGAMLAVGIPPAEAWAVYGARMEEEWTRDKVSQTEAMQLIAAAALRLAERDGIPEHLAHLIPTGMRRSGAEHAAPH